MADPKLDFRHLTVAERIQLVEDLWDSIADAPEVLELTEEQRAELDRRLEAHRRNPDEAIPWETLRRELLRGRRRRCTGGAALEYLVHALTVRSRIDDGRRKHLPK